MKHSSLNRINRITLYLETARLNSRRATCLRGQVGAVLVRDKRIIASGYNGPAKGQDHCNSTTCDLSKPCTHAIHAEANLIAYCAKQGIATDKAILIVTTCPCQKCSEIIIQSGINRIVYDGEYRNEDGLSLLLQAKITIVKYEPNIHFPDDFFI
jgi:dCMP deaminase